MCGVLYVESRHEIPLEKHQEALNILASRGPDFTRYQHQGNKFVAQTVLHITGSADFYNRDSDDFFAYNGEIYDYRWYGRYHNDTELVYSAAIKDHRLFRYFEGPWAWVHTDFERVRYASDPQGEHYLYRYQDHDLVIVCSEVAPILCYIDAVKVPVPYENKCWTMQQQTPWSGIERLEPGRLYVNHQPASQLDDIWSWIRPKTYASFDEAYEEFAAVWSRAMRIIKPDCATALSYSGGLDSSIIMRDITPAQLIAVNMVGKDPVVNRVREFLNQTQLDRLTEVTVDYKHYADDYIKLTQRTRMPAQSWSFVGKWQAAQACTQRVMLTGLGADELFGGYEIYKTLQYDIEKSHSPYSQHIDSWLWQRCLSVYNNDTRQATLLADYWCQVIGCDAPGLDRIGGSHGIETRNPFMLRSLMTLAFNLPWEFKVNTVTKPLIRTKFLKHWPEHLILPKMGFAGHANDALPWLDIDVITVGDRQQDWKQIAQQTFIKYA